jgi:hypothetical protein
VLAARKAAILSLNLWAFVCFLWCFYIAYLFNFIILSLGEICGKTEKKSPKSWISSINNQVGSRRRPRIVIQSVGQKEMKEAQIPSSIRAFESSGIGTASGRCPLASRRCPILAAQAKVTSQRRDAAPAEQL